MAGVICVGLVTRAPSAVSGAGVRMIVRVALSWVPVGSSLVRLMTLTITRPVFLPRSIG
jgi:hypothetical protein